MIQRPNFSIAILGAGPVGCALALQLARNTASPEEIVVLDAKPLRPDTISPQTSGLASPDPRILALSAGSAHLLQSLGIWESLAPCAQAITTVHVSRRGAFGRTLLHAAEHAMPALGYVLTYQSLLHTMQQALLLAPVRLWSAAQVKQVKPDTTGGALIECADGRSLHANYVMHAEGGRFDETAANPTIHSPVLSCASSQSALVATVRASIPRTGYAYERFCEQGPLALLPLGGSNYGLVWCGPPAQLQTLATSHDKDFNQALNQAFGQRLGSLQRLSACTVFPLGLRAERQLIEGCQVRLGNAAQILHPVAGQGLNLGLRDTQVLAQCLGGRSYASDLFPALERFAAQRQIDRWSTIGLTELFSQAFTWPLFANVASALLGLLDGCAPARHALARRMMFGHR